jgi:hypothetical protein
MTFKKICIAAALAALWSGTSYAAVSAEEAKQLGTTLTEFGAEKAGNADGSIPAYTGGIKTPPPDFKPGSGRYPDPYKDEKPLLKIDAKNMAQYASMITPGTKALLERFPDYYINIYPTHRSMGYPDWVLKNTVANATTAKLAGEVDGDAVEGAHAGIPFPIPKSGTEVMWNQQLRWSGVRTDMRFGIFLIDSSGRKTLAGDQETRFIYPYYDRNSKDLKNYAFETGYTTQYGPPSSVGGLALQNYSINHAVKDDTVWFYTPGQRRVRLAPESKYDTPAATVGGALLFDELGGYSGRMDRFDWKLVGKKEMYVPYNAYGVTFSPDAIGKQHVNPAVERWEKHRVWVVDSTLKTGKRHIFARRTFYIDEDSWSIVASEAYDSSGAMYRVGNYLGFPLYDKPRISQPGQIMYDMTKGDYVFSVYQADPQYFMKPFDDVMPNMSGYTPDAMSNSGVR